MVYYKDLTTSEVYGYDEIDSLQLPYIQQAIDSGWEDITGSYPLPPPTPTYQELRAREYPPVADYLDGIAKADDLQVQKYIDECLAVKAKYPKGN